MAVTPRARIAGSMGTGLAAARLAVFDKLLSKERKAILYPLPSRTSEMKVSTSAALKPVPNNQARAASSVT